MRLTPGDARLYTKVSSECVERSTNISHLQILHYTMYLVGCCAGHYRKLQCVPIHRRYFCALRAILGGQRKYDRYRTKLCSEGGEVSHPTIKAHTSFMQAKIRERETATPGSVLTCFPPSQASADQ